MKKALISILFGLLAYVPAHAQTAVALAPVAKAQFFNASGQPLSGGCIFTTISGTSTPLATWTDFTGTVQNTNPVILDSAGRANIWLGSNAYRFRVVSSGGSNCSTGTPQWTTDGVLEAGLSALTKTVLLNPPSRAIQVVNGPLTADYFTGATAHVTSPGVRVAILDPDTVLDTLTNPPTMHMVAPSAPGHIYTVPDPGVSSSYVMNPTAGTANALDCTLAGIACKRTAYFYLEGAGCNNSTASLGWDSFGANAATPVCITGTNIQKGVMGLSSATTLLQMNTGVNTVGTVALTYPAATVAGHLLIVSVTVDTSRTVTGCTDGTNAYTQAIHVANGVLTHDIWYFNGSSTAMPAGTTITCTLSAAGNSAMRWHEYDGVLTAAALDKTASATGTSTAVTSGVTAGTSQNTELVFVSMGSVGAPAVTAGSGFVEHGEVSQSTNVTTDTEGLVQQTTATQTGSFTLSGSQIWAGAVATFKANVGTTVSAQRSIVLPAFFLPTTPANALVKWQGQLLPTGTANAEIGVAFVCTQDGNSDDPAFVLTNHTQVAINNSASGILANTTLGNNNLVSAGSCAAGNMLHFGMQRLRYSTTDTYEGFIYVNGVGLTVGISQ